MNISPKGLELYKRLEGGFRPYPYRCSAGKLTIGWGHVILPHENFTEITLDEGLRILKEDIEKHERDLKRLLPESCLSKLKQNQYDALVIFIMNVGYNSDLVKSNMVKYLKIGAYEHAIDYWKQWINEKDEKTKQLVPSLGLINRRNAEIALFKSAS